MAHFEKLENIRAATGEPETIGLAPEIVKEFLESDQRLQVAIDYAEERFTELLDRYGDRLKHPEAELRLQLQEDILNFYPASAVCPYIALAARGPWIITAYGAVLFETGGYGMLGFGHNPDVLQSVLSAPQVMANVMTPSFAQGEIVELLKENIGFSRHDKQCPFQKFLFMNSGSEAMSVATRVTDLNARQQTDTGARHAGKKICFLSLKGSFHGRTGRPAQASSSTHKHYQQMASFFHLDNLLTVTPNDVDELRTVFSEVEKKGIFIECMLIEPVMGEGNPGQAITPDFYRVARELTEQHGSFLLVDSIQAGIRAHGCLSIVDYPGFESLPAPDMETYSKAINAGQFPMSVLALTARAAGIFKTKVYGNTMTANPRGLEIASSIIKQLTPELRANVVERGQEFRAKLEQLQQELPDIILSVKGTGLLLSAELNADYPVTGMPNIEHVLRIRGLNVIHGGTNALRFTPGFLISSKEIDLIIELVRSVLQDPHALSTPTRK